MSKWQPFFKKFQKTDRIIDLYFKTTIAACTKEKKKTVIKRQIKISPRKFAFSIRKILLVLFKKYKLYGLFSNMVTNYTRRWIIENCFSLVMVYRLLKYESHYMDKIPYRYCLRQNQEKEYICNGHVSKLANAPNASVKNSCHLNFYQSFFKNISNIFPWPIFTAVKSNTNCEIYLSKWLP